MSIFWIQYQPKMRSEKGGVLSLDSMSPCGMDSSGEPVFHTARDILLEKHPIGKPANTTTLLDPPSQTPCYDPIIFESLTGDVVK